MIRKAILIVLTLIGFYYSFRFGYIWTAYVHGGQMMGIPFALVLLITTIKYFIAKTTYHKNKTFAFGIIYFIILAAFSLTIELIMFEMNNYFEFLYHESEGYINKIFLGYLIVGVVALFITFRSIKNSQLSSNKLKSG